MARKYKTSGQAKDHKKHLRMIFVEEMIQHGNQTRAALACGSTEASACTTGSRLFSDPVVKRMIEERRAAILDSKRLKSEEVIESMARAIRFDFRKMFTQAYDLDGRTPLLDEKGRPLMRLMETWELDDDTALALQAIEYDQIKIGGRLAGHTAKIKACDRNAARDQAARHFGLYDKDNAQRNGDQKPTKFVVLFGKDDEAVEAKA